MESEIRDQTCHSFIFRNIFQLNKFCSLLQQLRFWPDVYQKTVKHQGTATRVNIFQTNSLLPPLHFLEPWVINIIYIFSQMLSSSGPGPGRVKVR